MCSIVTCIVSIGELLDKLTILEIKIKFITDSRYNDVKKEFDTLYIQVEDKISELSLYYNTLKYINEEIWHLMDKVRTTNFDTDKDIWIDLCKKTLDYNDIRFRVKNKINYLSNSFLKEQKGYNKTIFEICITPSDRYSNKLIESVIFVQSLLFDTVIVKCNYDITGVFDFNNDSSIVIQYNDNPLLIDNIDTVYDTLKDNYIFKYIYSILNK
jgi:hypothetical protein